VSNLKLINKDCPSKVLEWKLELMRMLKNNDEILWNDMR
jgi:hypothetical protein